MRLAPNDAEAQSALGWVLAQQGETDAAVAHLRAAIKAKPGFVDARLTLAGVLSQQGKSAEARAGSARGGEDRAAECRGSSHAGEDSEPAAGR